MKRKRTILASISILLVAIGVTTAPKAAFALPYETTTLGPNGQLSTCPDVYVPSNKITISNSSSLSEKSLSNPEDMVFDDENQLIYVADTGNKRVVILSNQDQYFASEISSYTNIEGEDISFKEPTGLAMNNQYLLVADKQLEKIVVFNKNNLSFVKEISKPESNLIGSLTKFVPTKICIDERNSLYAVLEGCSKGVMQLDINGNFIGYIGANSTIKSLLSRLQNIFKVNNDDYLLASGMSVTNVAIDSKGLVYTITNKAQDNAVKKLNTTGNAILTPNVNEPDTVNMFIDASDNMFTVQSKGYVTAYDSYGSLLFKFGGKGDEEILGSLKSPSAICGSLDKELLILDKEANIIIKYKPTYFMSLLYTAIDYYKDGLYLQGQSSWEEVLKYDNKFILAYKALGKASMKNKDYKLALEQFRLAEDKEGYSEAYWKIRDEWIRSNLGWVLLPIIVLLAFILVYKTLKEKKPKLVAPIEKFKAKVMSVPILGDITYGFKYIKNPRDCVYEIKYKNKCSIASALVLYGVFALIQVVKVYLTGFLFNPVHGNVDAIKSILLSIGALFALVLSNYFVASVTDGEGKLKRTFICMIYALFPYLVLSIPIFLISRILTYNESFIYYLLKILCIGWTGINIILTTMELHDYTFGKALINLILTVICLVLVLVFIFIIYVLGYQLFSFLVSLLKGVMV